MSQHLKSFHVFSLEVRRVFDLHSLQALNKVSSFHGLFKSNPFVTGVMCSIIVMKVYYYTWTWFVGFVD